MCFYDNFIKLCKTKGVAPSKALIEAGLSKSLNSKWASNPYSTPNGETLTRLAAYFGCSITELSTEIILSKEEQQELYNLFETACNAQGYSCAHAIVQAKVKNNFLNRLKNQCLSRPYLPDVYSVAQYLNIVDGVNLFFDAIIEAKKPTVKDDELSEYDMEIMELLRLIPEERKPNVTAILKEHLRLSGLIE